MLANGFTGGTRTSVKTLVTASKSGKYPLNGIAALSLGKIGMPESEKALMQAFKEGDSKKKENVGKLLVV